MAQAIHAARQFVHEHPEVEKNWFDKSNTIVCLNVDNLEALLGYTYLAVENGLRVSLFKEPDLNDEATAIAIEPSFRASEICKDLPLALNNL